MKIKLHLSYFLFLSFFSYRTKLFLVLVLMDYKKPDVVLGKKKPIEVTDKFEEGQRIQNKSSIFSDRPRTLRLLEKCSWL